MTSIRDRASGPKLPRGLLHLKSFMRRVFRWSAAMANYNHFLTSRHTHRDYTGQHGNHRWKVEIGTFLAAASPCREAVAWNYLAQAGVFVTVDGEGRPETGEAKINRVYLTLKEK